MVFAAGVRYYGCFGYSGYSGSYVLVVGAHFVMWPGLDQLVLLESGSSFHRCHLCLSQRFNG